MDGESASGAKPRVTAGALVPLTPAPGDLADKTGLPFSRREHDYLLIAIFVRIQHLRFAEAKTLIDGFLAIGMETPELIFASAVTENRLGNYEAALEAVRRSERIEPAAMHARGKASSRVRMRSYIKARATYALTGALDDEGRAALDFYLRLGRRRRPGAGTED